MEYTVKALADLSGVTARTLRWYDQEGLLRPLRTTQAGYRIYGSQEVDRLQQILFYREIGFSLPAIRQVLDDPQFDRQAALQSHLAALRERRTRLDALILTVQKTIDQTRGGTTMSDKEKFDAFKQKAIEENEAKYGKELREKYGDGEIDRANANMHALSQEEYEQWQALDEEIRAALAAAVQSGAAPGGREGLRIAQLHRHWLSYSWAAYSPQAHRGLAEMYLSDPRFTAYYDKALPGCAAFLRNAVAAYTAAL